MLRKSLIENPIVQLYNILVNKDKLTNDLEAEPDWNPLLIMEKSNPPSVNDVVLTRHERIDWDTRVGGKLERPIYLKNELATKFARPEFTWGKLPQDHEDLVLFGHRQYSVRKLDVLGNFAGKIETSPYDFQGPDPFASDIGELDKKKAGGNEFHRKRDELFYVKSPEGVHVLIVLEDIEGNITEVQLRTKDQLYLPRGIIHTYYINLDDPTQLNKLTKEEVELLLDETEIYVTANTEFDENDKRTYDTFPRKEHRQLQLEYKNLTSYFPNPK